MWTCLGWLVGLQEEMAAYSPFPGKVKTTGPQKAQLQDEGWRLVTSLSMFEVTAHVKTMALVMCNS